MKNMIWHPEEQDNRVNQYLEQTNHAPYELIIASLIGLFFLFTVFILFGTV